MNYDTPRQRESDKRWNYTQARDGLCWPIGYCQGWRWPSPGPMNFPAGFATREHYKEHYDKAVKFKSKHHTNGHGTAEEAAACYKEYLLDHDLRLDKTLSDQQLKCVVCGEWTQKFAEVTWANSFALCPEHMNRKSVEDRFTVSTGTVIHS